MSEDLRPSQLVDHLFRHEYGKMVAVLSRFLGLSHLDTVEDIVQETFIQAMQTWRAHSTPDNPSAWLITVAKRKAIDLIRKSKKDRERELKVDITGPSSAYIEELFMESEIADNQLRMIFACCHPALAAKDQIALTLKIVSGFSLKEIAKALLTNAEVIKKRIQRAKKFIQSNGLKLTIPTGNALTDRLERVHQVLYLIFNEGYYSSSSQVLIRQDLCLEAMRLCKIATEHEHTKHTDNLALMALMCYHSSRFESRLTTDGEMILLADQDRSTWNQQLINIGHYHLFHCFRQATPTSFHWEAAISSEHARAKSFKETNWILILEYYQNLLNIRRTDQIILNQIVVLIQLNRLTEAEALLKAIDDITPHAVMYHSIRSEISFQLEDYEEALEHIVAAEASSPTTSELRVIQDKKKRYKDLLIS